MSKHPLVLASTVTLVGKGSGEGKSQPGRRKKTSALRTSFNVGIITYLHQGLVMAYCCMRGDMSVTLFIVGISSRLADSISIASTDFQYVFRSVS